MPNPSNTSKKNALRLFTATGDIDDYFRRLGGAGRYSGYRDWHSPALIIIAIDQILSHEILDYERDVTDLISPRMWFKTDDIPHEAMGLVTKINPSHEEVDAFINEITEAISRKFGVDEQEGWNKFLLLRDQRKT
jgi:hypothetical protein